MKIEDKSRMKALEPQVTLSSPKTAKYPKAQPQASSVDISDEARDMQKLESIVAATPDLRADKVAALKAQIQAGTYKVDSAGLADRIIAEHVSGHFGKNSF